MKRDYKVGQRVNVVREMDGNEDIVGKIARVIHLNTAEENGDSDCLLEFDEELPNEGHDGNSRGKQRHCWYVNFKCIKPLKEKFNLNDIVKVLSGDHKYEVGTILNYTDEQGRWPVQIGLNKVIHLKPRYLVLEGRKQLI